MECLCHHQINQKADRQPNTHNMIRSFVRSLSVHVFCDAQTHTHIHTLRQRRRGRMVRDAEGRGEASSLGGRSISDAAAPVRQADQLVDKQSQQAALQMGLNS